MADINSLIAGAAGKYGLNPDQLLKQFTVESALNPNAVSPKGALGVAQVMPATAREMGYDPAMLSDPATSIDAGSKYMQRMYQQVQKMNPSLQGEALDRAALAAYNAGAGGAREYIMSGDESKLPKETQGYINKIKGQSQSLKPSVFDAYFSGKMDQADAEKVKSLIDSGAVKVPAKYQASKKDQFSQSVIAAYQSGKMTPEDRVKFEDAVNENPALLPKGVTIGALKNAPQEKGLLEKAGDVVTKAAKGGLGLGESALTVGTSMIAAPVAGFTAIADTALSGGTPEDAKQLANKLAESITYTPKTEAGQQSLQAIGDILGNETLQKMLPAVPMAAEFQGAAQLGRAAAAPAVAKAAQVGEKVAEAAAPVVQKAVAPVKSAVSSVLERSATIGQKGKEAAKTAADWFAPAAQKAPPRAGSVGAAATPEELQRIARARELGFTGETGLTEGQVTRNPAQQAFESDLAKTAEGEAINQRYTAQNQQIINTMDNFIDATGKQAPTKLEGGRQVVEVLGEAAERRKNQIRAAYKAAENSEEANAPVTLDTLVEHINQSGPEALNAKSLSVARAKMLQLGAAVEDDAGNLVAQPVKLKDAERLRTAIGNAAGNDASDIRQVTIMKDIFDKATEGAGGALYKKARGLRSQFAKDFENRGVIANLINTKRGSDDRIVAMENVMDKTMFGGSLDDVRHMRKVLQTSGADGKQAWKELQGATLEKLKEASLTNAKDSMGNPVVSPAAFAKQVKALDQAGKLDFVFGKQGAEKIRDLSDLIQDVKVFVPGSVNASNNRNAIMAGFMDAGVNAMLTGVPLPAVTIAKATLKAARNRETMKRVGESLKYSERF